MLLLLSRSLLRLHMLVVMVAAARRQTSIGVLYDADEDAEKKRVPEAAAAAVDAVHLKRKAVDVPTLICFFFCCCCYHKRTKKTEPVPMRVPGARIVFPKR